MMARNVTPMIHVPDVRAAVEWYQSIGFKALRWNEPDGYMDWALLSFGDGEIMFNEGGSPSTAERREVDLYVYVENVDDLYQDLKDRVEVIEPPHDTFYCMRELIIRDLNRFWITFVQQLEGNRS